MMNKRHLTAAEKQVIRAIVDDAGAVETIRIIGQMVANDHFDLARGTELRSMLMRAAKELDSDSGPGVE